MGRGGGYQICWGEGGKSKCNPMTPERCKLARRKGDTVKIDPPRVREGCNATPCRLYFCAVAHPVLINCALLLWRLVQYCVNRGDDACLFELAPCLYYHVPDMHVYYAM